MTVSKVLSVLSTAGSFATLLGRLLVRFGSAVSPSNLDDDQLEMNLDPNSMAQDLSAQGAKDEKPVRTPKVPFGRRQKVPSRSERT
jgi:hypothetical protein